MSASRATALVMLPGGGFTFETRCLLQSLEAELDFIYLATEFGGVPGEAGIPAGELHRVPSFESVTRRSKLRSAYAFVRTFAHTVRLLAARNVDVVLGVGCSHLIPMFLAAKLLRKRTVFVETITRADTLSSTGSIIYKLQLSNRFVVQWPELKRMYPGATLGAVL